MVSIIQGNCLQDTKAIIYENKSECIKGKKYFTSKMFYLLMLRSSMAWQYPNMERYTRYLHSDVLDRHQ